MKDTRKTPRRQAIDVADRLHSASIHVLRRVRAQDARSGLSAARLSAMSVIVFGGPVTLGRLAEAEQVSAPTMTRMVAALEEEGLVARQADSRDRRVVWLRPTERGRRTLEEGRRRRVRALAAALAALDARELDVVAEAIGLIEQSVLRPARHARGSSSS